MWGDLDLQKLSLLSSEVRQPYKENKTNTTKERNYSTSKQKVKSREELRKKQVGK